jgi:chemotaxis signal transduction protein
MSQTLTTQAGQSVLLATFFVRDALCALDAAGIQEVIRLGPVTPVDYAPEEVRGIVNLRGKIVTIVDLGLRLGFPKAVAGPDRVDDVLELRRGNGSRGRPTRAGVGAAFPGSVREPWPGDYAAGRRPDFEVEE